jgi:nitroreductase
MYAPSAVNKQPWHFIVFRDKVVVQKLVEVNSNAKMLEKSSAGIVICYDKKLEHDTGYGPIDCAAATQNMLLAAHGLGLGACWVGVYPRENRMEALHKVFHLPEHVLPFAVISLGYAAEEKDIPLRLDKKRIHINRWKE